jgi:hypothetical protein
MNQRTLIQNSLDQKPEIQAAMQELQAAQTLQAMAIPALKLGRAVAACAIAAELDARGQAGQAASERPLCPICGKPLESKGLVERQMVTLCGVVKWKRRQYRDACGCGNKPVCPSDQALGITSYQRYCKSVKRLACLLAVFLPYGLAAMLLSQCVGVIVSLGSINDWVAFYGAIAMRRLDRELQQLRDGQEPEPEKLSAVVEQLPLLIGADEVMAPFRPNEGSPAGKTRYRGVKVGIFARLKKMLNRKGEEVSRLEQRRVVAVLGDATEIEERLRLEALRQGIKTAPLVVWLSDGAIWLWKIFGAWFSQYAIGILDFYHAAQHLWCAASALLDGRKRLARLWFVQARSYMRRGMARRIIAELKRADKLTWLTAENRKIIRLTADYLQIHEAHLNYVLFKELGLPLGSGFVESTCKWLIQQRFKGVGMRWSESGFNALLHLRIEYVNGRFDTLFY